jgi:hypothetical protein
MDVMLRIFSPILIATMAMVAIVAARAQSTSPAQAAPAPAEASATAASAEPVARAEAPQQAAPKIRVIAISRENAIMSQSQAAARPSPLIGAPPPGTAVISRDEAIKNAYAATIESEIAQRRRDAAAQQDPRPVIASNTPAPRRVSFETQNLNAP